MDSNKLQSAIAFETFQQEVEQCKKQCQKVGLLAYLIGFGGFISSICLFGKFYNNLYADLLLYLGIFFMLPAFFGAVLLFRGLYFTILLKEENMMRRKWEKVTAGECNHPSKTQKKSFRIAIIIAVFILALIIILSGIEISKVSNTPSCGHAACKDNGPFPCIGKNNTCPNTTDCYKDLYCDDCD